MFILKVILFVDHSNYLRHFSSVRKQYNVHDLNFQNAQPSRTSHTLFSYLHPRISETKSVSTSTWRRFKLQRQDTDLFRGHKNFHCFCVILGGETMLATRYVHQSTADLTTRLCGAQRLRIELGPLPLRNTILLALWNKIELWRWRGDSGTDGRYSAVIFLFKSKFKKTFYRNYAVWTK